MDYELWIMDENGEGMMGGRGENGTCEMLNVK
jgi:hypothetical protein